MSSLKERLAVFTGKGVPVSAPELGTGGGGGGGGVVYVKRFTIGERTRFNEIVDRQKKEREEKAAEWLVDKHTAELVTFVAVEEDGKPSFTEGDAEAVMLLPASLAERMIRVAQNAAVDRVATSDADAKKPSPSSPATTNSNASSN